MTRTLIKQVDAIALDEAGTVLRAATIAIDGDTLVAVGDAPVDFAPDEVVDGYNHVALPGFVNAHCHAAMTHERGWAEDLSLSQEQVDNSCVLTAKPRSAISA